VVETEDGLRLGVPLPLEPANLGAGALAVAADSRRLKRFRCSTGQHSEEDVQHWINRKAFAWLLGAAPGGGAGEGRQ